ncbi:MAG: YggS family pyridoxal phosphate-dependent enzyme [Candidatus Omnitrophica bacterium]|nr:YggS family pyridoxal phosphate-dependent enzyme [Candidatus Omnitrophota bacterium]
MGGLDIRLEKLNKSINAVLEKSKRVPEDILVVLVTKQAQPEDILLAIKAGYNNIAENRVQELIRKFEWLKQVLDPQAFSCLRWHLVGHLQTNKAEKAVRYSDMIQSVDSLRLAQRINAEAQKQKKCIKILLQINITLEESKFGVLGNKAAELVEEMIRLPFIRVKGLMSIGPLSGGPAQIRACFRHMRKIFEQINFLLVEKRYEQMQILSMGMSEDYQIAIEEGSTMLRLGRAVFGG